MTRPTIDGPTFQQRPLLCQEQPTFRFGKIERLADVVAAEIDPIYSFRQFSRETDTHPGCDSCNSMSQVTRVQIRTARVNGGGSNKWSG